MELRGMYSDSINRANHPDGTWTEHTKNIVITRDKKAISNENGFSVYSTNYPNTSKPIGYISLYNDEIILFSFPSEIGILRNNGNYETIIKDNLLGFSEDKIVSGTKQYNIFGETEIVFTDGNIPLSLLNITKLPFELDSNKALVNQSLINNIYVFPDMGIPNINITNVNTTGGSIPTGVIYFSGQYEDYNGSVSNPFPISNPVLIIQQGTTYSNTSGSESSVITSNSVSLSITNIDTRFKKLRLLVIKKNGGQQYPEQFASLSISSDSLSYTYTGSESITELTLEEVLVNRPSYKTAKGVLSYNDILYPYGMTSMPSINIQKYVNNWKVKYVTEDINLKITNNSFKDGKIYATKRPFMHNEVYALYAVPIMLDGSYGDAFHIPGREVGNISGNIFGVPYSFAENATFSSLSSSSIATNFQEELTNFPNAKYFQTRDTSGINGKLGYWENQNETYPNNDDWDIVGVGGTIGSLRNSKVRHHKMPSHSKHGYLENDYSTAPILGLEISDIWLPENIKSKIQSIEIFYAKRTGSNSTLAGRGLLMFNGIIERHSPLVYPSNINMGVGLGGGDNRSLDFGSIRIQAFDILIDKSNIMPNYLFINTKINKHIYADEVGGVLHLRQDYTDSFNMFTSIPPENLRIRSIKEQKYLPANTYIQENLTNRFGEETFYAKLNNTSLEMTIEFFNRNNRSIGWQPEVHQTFLVDLCVYREDVYNTLEGQDLVSTGNRILPNQSTITNIFGGDAYVGTHGFIATSHLEGVSDTNPIASVTKFKYFVETANAPELRVGDFYPKVDIGIGPIEPYIEYPNLNYNKDYTSINNLNYVSPYDVNNRVTNIFPNRILRSKKSQREEKVSSWRIFLANDYFETARDRGEIVHVEALNGELLIQQQYGLFITRAKDTFETTSATVQVGSGDVFAREPDEIVDTKDGYIGCQHKTVCIKGKAFYFVADANQGKVFVLDNMLKEISNEGMYDFFREYLKEATSIFAAYDELYNRIILCVNNKDAISYSFEIKAWVALHDYTPDMIMYTANKVLSTKNNVIYLHNVDGIYGRYYVSSPKSSYVELVKTYPLINIVNNILWKTQSIKDRKINTHNTFTSVILYNDKHCSGEIPLSHMKNIRYTEGIWFFNDFRDMVKDSSLYFMDEDGNLIDENINMNKPFFKKSRIFGDYLCIRLIFNNLSNNQLLLSECNVNDRISPR